MLLSVIEINRPLELAITHTCNLSCEGCSHFSDYKHNWFISLDQVKNWIKPWSKRIQPTKLFNILGGEPTLHKQLCEIIVITRQYFPTANLGMTTNGFHLHKHPDLFNILKKLKIKLKFSIHSQEIAYMNLMNDNIELAKEWSKKGINVEWAKVWEEGWRKNYLNYGNNMMPFKDENPRSSWNNCMCRCYQIVDGKIWKCPQIAYLKMQYEKFNLSGDWKKYLDWKPLSPEASWGEQIDFFKKEEEFICGMCPAQPNMIKRTSPLKYGCLPDNLIQIKK
jgi:hypothetical protein